MYQLANDNQIDDPITKKDGICVASATNSIGRNTSRRRCDLQCEMVRVMKVRLTDVMTKGLLSAPAYEVCGKMIADEVWESHGATAVIGLKDADLALEAAEVAEMPLPSTHI